MNDAELIARRVSSSQRLTSMGLMPPYQLDASDANTLELVDGKVARWANKGGRSSDVFQDDAALRPSLVENAYNGRPTIRFSNSRMRSEETTAFSGVGGATICAVTRYTAIRAFAQHIVNVSPVGSPQSRMLLAVRPNSGYGVGGRRLDADAFQTTIDTTNRTNQLAVVSGVLDYQNRVVELWVNGSLIQTLNNFQTAGVTDGSPTELRIGGNPSISVPLIGDISEIIAYPYPLNRTVLANKTAKLAEKWGVALP